MTTVEVMTQTTTQTTPMDTANELQACKEKIATLEAMLKSKKEVEDEIATMLLNHSKEERDCAVRYMVAVSLGKIGMFSTVRDRARRDLLLEILKNPSLAPNQMTLYAINEYDFYTRDMKEWKKEPGYFGSRSRLEALLLHKGWDL